MSEPSPRDKKYLEVRDGGCLTLGIGKRYRVELTSEIMRISNSLQQTQVELKALDEDELTPQERHMEKQDILGCADDFLEELKAALVKQGCPDNTGFAIKTHKAYQKLRMRNLE